MPTIEELLDRDQLRVGYIQRKASAGRKDAVGTQKEAATFPTTLGSSLDSLHYVITISIGTPPVTQTVLIDTGSDVSWVQCAPCLQCHPQADPLFDPSSSSTYSPFSCSSVECLLLDDTACTSSSQCQYVVKYGGGSNTTGTYSSDTLELGGPNVVVQEFQFGCSHVESGFVSPIDGLMGLGGGPQSLVSQTAGRFGSALSYCLPPTAATSGFLTLGAANSGLGFVTTPLLSSQQIPTYYFVVLEGITLNGQLLDVPPSVFSAGGTILDSGTIITRLPPTAYAALSSTFKAAMQQYPAAPPKSLFDTCFDFTGLTSVTVPPVSLVFSGGAVVDLDPSGIIFNGCLTFAANRDDRSLGIIGNVQQRTFEVLYDVGQGVVGFRAGAC
ncbi:hypothetical protein EJB05_15837, partial [Eragrostis curvula]